MQPVGEVESLLQLNRVKFFKFNYGEKVLDFGGGDGNVWSENLKNEKNLKIDLFEPDKNLINIAKKKGIYENFFESKNQINKSIYDSVTCFGVLEHIKFAENILENLNGHKKIHIVVPNANSFHRQIGVEKGIIKNIYELSENDYKVGHQKYYDKDSLLRDMKYLLQKGYKVKKFGSVSFKFLDNKSSEKILNIFSEINVVAKKLELIGENFFYGAELAISLERTKS